MSPRRIVVNILATIGALALLGVGYFGLIFYGTYGVFGGTDEPSMQENLASPTGDFRAVRISSTGGGAAGWCREFIVVRRSDATQSVPSYPQAQSELVFSASCDTDFTMSWTTPSQLVVRYKAAPGRLASIEVRPTHRTLNVAVRAEPEA